MYLDSLWIMRSQRSRRRDKGVDHMTSFIGSISSYYNIGLLLQDMSKAFDTVYRIKLLDDKHEERVPDELPILSILINDVTLKK